MMRVFPMVVGLCLLIAISAGCSRQQWHAMDPNGAFSDWYEPDLPTVAETVPGYEVDLWYGFVGPAGLPADIVRSLNAAIVAALDAPDVRQRLGGQGVDVGSSTPEAFGKLLAADMVRWAKFVRLAGIKVQ